MKVIFSVAFITLLVSFFFTKRKLSRLEEEQKLSVDELWDKKRTSYLTEISKFEKLQEEATRKYNEEKTRIDNEITEKQNFNNSLFRGLEYLKYLLGVLFVFLSHTFLILL